MFDGLKHSCVEGNHIVNIFSFSKAYGMMGWRIGYVSNVLSAHRSFSYLFLVNLRRVVVTND